MLHLPKYCAQNSHHTKATYKTLFQSGIVAGEHSLVHQFIAHLLISVLINKCTVYRVYTVYRLYTVCSECTVYSVHFTGSTYCARNWVR